MISYTTTYKMKTFAKILQKTTNEGNTLTTFHLCYPNIIHNELMTHRRFSRNSSSNRAIPIKFFVDTLTNDPFIPTFNQNKKGMVSGEELAEEKQIKAIEIWKKSAEFNAKCMQELSDLGASKETVNRLAAPFIYVHTIVTSTEWDNFFALRLSPDAQPEMRELAECMYEEYLNYNYINETNCHHPLVTTEEIAEVNVEDLSNKFYYLDQLIKSDVKQFTKKLDVLKLLVSANRCKRVSHYNIDKKLSIEEEIDGALESLRKGHYSIAEHQAVYVKGSLTLNPANFYIEKSGKSQYIPLRHLFITNEAEMTKEIHSCAVSKFKNKHL